MNHRKSFQIYLDKIITWILIQHVCLIHTAHTEDPFHANLYTYRSSTLKIFRPSSKGVISSCHVDADIHFEKLLVPCIWQYSSLAGLQAYFMIKEKKNQQKKKERKKSVFLYSSSKANVD